MQSGAAADGSYLLAVDDGDKRTLLVWEWRSRRLVARTVVSRISSSSRIIPVPVPFVNLLS